jgi:7-carboxy-7-deazaguanine synthase
MFGTNEIVGQKYFKTAPERSLFVTSMFFTLQGEGPYNGMPALFIRLAKCNLACSFCDTFFDDGDWMTYEQISSKAQETVMRFWTDQNLVVPDWVLKKQLSELGKGIEDIIGVNAVLVVTGGEPLLQSNLMEYLNVAKNEFSAMQIESNGTVNQDVPAHVTLVCSPKCAEKNGVATKYLSPTQLILERADCLKFVMSAEQDSPYSEVPGWAHEWKAKNPSKEIFVSPMNIYNTFPQKIKLLRAEKGQITMEERSTVDEVISFWEPGLLDLAANQKNHEYVARYCMQHGLRLNLQMHLYASLA